jgi:cell wall-associated NlpC family hydrolase
VVAPASVLTSAANAAPSAKVLAARSAARTAAKSKAKPTVSSVEKELSALAIKNTELVEQYDEAQITVSTRQKAAAKAQAAERAAQVELNQASVELSRSALAEYEGGSFSAAGALLSSNGGTNYLDQLETMQMISAHSAEVVSSYTTAQQAANVAKQNAEALLASATKTRDSVLAQRAAVRAQVAKYSSLLATLTAAQQTAYQNRVEPTATAAQRAAVQVTLPDITSTQIREAITFALAQVGKPYVFGAAGPDSYDCSGLTMAAYAAAGISLPHSAAEQYNYGHHVSYSDLQPGDLMFFYRPQIGHVTMYIGDGLMISAPETGEDVKVMPAGTFGGNFVGATRLISS